MHYNSAPPLMVENDLRWAIWLPPTTGIAPMWQRCHPLHRHKVKCSIKPNDMILENPNILHEKNPNPHKHIIFLKHNKLNKVNIP